MTTAKKCEAIVRKIVEWCNERGEVIRFESDYGGNTLTIYTDETYTHVGCDPGTFADLVDDLYNTLNEGPEERQILKFTD